MFNTFVILLNLDVTQYLIVFARVFIKIFIYRLLLFSFKKEGEIVNMIDTFYP